MCTSRRRNAVCVALAFALLAVAVTPGCKRETPAGPQFKENTAAWEKAIAEYLEARNMDMAADALDQFKIEGDTATVVYAMKQKDEIYNLRVRWKFTFKRTPDGGWRVETYQAE